MKLSEAIRLGSLLVATPRGGATAFCAIGMALRAVGVEPVGTPWASILDHSRDYHEMTRKWPWLVEREGGAKCPVPACNFMLRAHSIIYHPFDWHVINDKSMTIDQLADWIASIEPPDDSTSTSSSVPEVRHSPERVTV